MFEGFDRIFVICVVDIVEIRGVIFLYVFCAGLICGVLWCDHCRPNTALPVQSATTCNHLLPRDFPTKVFDEQNTIYH